MRTFGILVLVAGGVAAAAYFGGYFNGSVDVQLTDKGRTTVNEGLQSAGSTLNEVLEKAKVDKAPQLSPKAAKAPTATAP